MVKLCTLTSSILARSVLKQVNRSKSTLISEMAHLGPEPDAIHQILQIYPILPCVGP